MAASPFSSPTPWQFATEPSLDELEAIAAKAFRQLPQQFQALCEDLVIRVEDFPTDEVLHRLKAKSKESACRSDSKAPLCGCRT